MYIYIILDKYNAIIYKGTGLCQQEGTNSNPFYVIHPCKWDMNNRSKADDWRKYIDEVVGKIPTSSALPIISPLFKK